MVIAAKAADLILGNTPLPPDRPQRPAASEEPGQRAL
jgi:hypothetical protein